MRNKLFLICVVGLSLAAASADKVRSARVLIGNLGAALDKYYADCSEYPPSLKELVEKPQSCKKWGPKPYLTSIPKDPWGHDFLYMRPDPAHYEVKSLGADGKEGGVKDDMDIAIVH